MTQIHALVELINLKSITLKIEMRPAIIKNNKPLLVQFLFPDLLKL